MLIAAGASSNAAPPSEFERYYLGHYVVRTEDSSRDICQAEILWQDDVGGEFVSQGCEAVPDLAAAARWHFDPEAGEAKFEDVLHRARFRLAETDAGFIAILPDESRYWFERTRTQTKKHLRRAKTSR
ncbi:hypothetical protein [Sphingomonas crocodyli]|uniref:Uncharacterized protein n=1 Tax=Sphingomonas crocodyli TaxID=1979270 RepID=A0A437LXV6_9SPHN|nr:hypothetical protein [Sphingomonas crocodyli]RVT90249.1 hypothetical protein EOD43_18315 [Sphingomonas crocodyli]